MHLEPSFPMAFDPGDDTHVYNVQGVDLSLIRWCLSLTLEERLQTLQDHVNALLNLRHETTITRFFRDVAGVPPAQS